jgi:hypothetical protein
MDTQENKCMRGLPIDNERLADFEQMCHYLVRRHFPTLSFPSGMTYEDLVNACRYEVVIALKKVDPEKALTSNIEDPDLREQKIAEKLADPIKALAQAEKNISYWQIDNFLKRLKWNHGVRTAAKKRRIQTISWENLVRTEPDNLSVGGEIDLSKVYFDSISNSVRAELQDTVNHMVWLNKFRGASTMKRYLSGLSEPRREVLLEYLQHVVAQQNIASPLLPAILTAEPDEDLGAYIT